MMSAKERAWAAAAELKRREAARKPILDLDFPEQAAFVADPEQFMGALCTRRAGKSHGIGMKLYNAARKHPKALCPYVGLTRESCENIMWPILDELNTKYNLGAELTVSDLEATLPNGAKIKLFGADQKKFIEKLRGPKYPIAVVDEVQAFGAHIETLIDDVFTPATADYLGGQIVLTGTPGPVPKGYFFDCSEGKNGFKFHKWTVYQNPYFPRPREFVADLFQKKNWTPDNPTYRREWLGEWVADEDALVYKFKDHNWIDALPEHPRHEYLYVIGVDLGYSPDPSAFVVAAYNPYDKHLFFIECHTQLEMTVGDVADRVKYYLKLYPEATVVMDLGAQGKMIGAEIETRYHIPVVAAQKNGKDGFIEILNSELRSSTIKVLRGTMEPLVEEWQSLIWDAEKEKRVEDPRYPNHFADAALYTLRYCHNHAFTNRPQVPKRGTEEEMDAYWEREAARLERQLAEEKEAAREAHGLIGY